MRWGMRFIGLATTIILARLLDLFDFGIIAMAMVVIGLLQLVTWTGVDLALIKERNPTRDHYDSAWTIQIIQGLFLACLLLIAAPFSEAYFNEPEVVAVIRTMALNAVILGFGNIGTVEFRKKLDFAKEFRFGLYKKLAMFCVTVPAAILIGNYWAVVISLIFGSIVGVVLSYVMHPYRPRISTKKIKDIWSFSQWLLVSRIGLFLNRKVDAIMVGNLMGTSSMGLYHVSYEIGTLFSSEFVMPIRRALFPNVALIKDDKTAFDSAIYTVVGAVAFLGLASGFGVAAIADEFTHFVLGEKWSDAAILIYWLAIYGAFAGVALGLEVVLLATDRPHISAMEAWGQLIIIVPMIYWAAHTGELAAIAEIRAVIGGIFLLIMGYLVSRTCGLSFRKITFSITRPMAAALIMFWTIAQIKPVSESPSFWIMIAAIIGGAAVFVVSAALIWLLTGKPAGIETIVVERAKQALAGRPPPSGQAG